MFVCSRLLVNDTCDNPCKTACFAALVRWRHENHEILIKIRYLRICRLVFEPSKRTDQILNCIRYVRNQALLHEKVAARSTNEYSLKQLCKCTAE